jgi:hypothetical protein
MVLVVPLWPYFSGRRLDRSVYVRREACLVDPHLVQCLWLTWSVAVEQVEEYLVRCLRQLGCERSASRSEPVAVMVSLGHCGELKLLAWELEQP